jgi:hypothetical protein
LGKKKIKKIVQKKFPTKKNSNTNTVVFYYNNSFLGRPTIFLICTKKMSADQKLDRFQKFLLENNLRTPEFAERGPNFIKSSGNANSSGRGASHLFPSVSSNGHVPGNRYPFIPVTVLELPHR